MTLRGTPVPYPERREKPEPSPFPHDPDYSAQRVESPEQIVVGVSLAAFAVFTLLVLIFVS